jgi:phosphatidylglycerophosphate synthase
LTSLPIPEHLLSLLVLAPFALYFLVRLAQYLALKALGRGVPVDQEMIEKGESFILGRSLRQIFAFSAEPIHRILQASGVTPDFLTLANLAFSIIAASLIGLESVSLGGTVALLGSALDYLDGRLARDSGRVSLAGNFLDSTLDRYSDIALLSGAAVLFRDSAPMLTVCLLGVGSAAVIPYTRAKAESLGYDLKVGLMQRPERIVLFCTGAILTPFADPLFPASMQGVHALFAGTVLFLAILATVTAVHRTVAGYAALRR